MVPIANPSKKNNDLLVEAAKIVLCRLPMRTSCFFRVESSEKGGFLLGKTHSANGP